VKSLLEVNNLTKNFGGVEAVKNVSFSIVQGSRTGIIGPNGAGKTTLFNVIAGVFPSTAGKVMFKDEEITNLKPFQICKKGIVRTFQKARVFNSITVEEHVMMGVVSTKPFFSSEITVEDEEAVKKILILTNMYPYQTKLVKDLTIAQQKKIGVATALATKPELLLLDEVMAGLDLTEVNKFLKVLYRINEEMGITILIVEHIMRVIMSLCKKIIVLDNGRKLAEGIPEEISNNKKVIEAYLGKEA